MTEKYFVINLKTRKDRWEKIQTEFEKQDIRRYTQFIAIKISWKTLHKHVNRMYPSFLKNVLECHPSFSMGTIGAYLSHLSLWYKCLQLKKPILIFEDDIRFQHSFSFPKEIEQLRKEVCNDFDIISFFPNMDYNILSYVSPRTCVPNPIIFGAYAYMIHPQFVQKALQSMEKMFYPFDTQIKHLFRTNQRILLTVNPLLYTDVHKQRDSDILHYITKRSKDVYRESLLTNDLDPSLQPPFIYIRKKITRLNLKVIFQNCPCTILKLYYNSVLYLYIHHKNKSNFDSCSLDCTKDQLDYFFPNKILDEEKKK